MQSPPPSEDMVSGLTSPRSTTPPSVLRHDAGFEGFHGFKPRLARSGTLPVVRMAATNGLQDDAQKASDDEVREARAARSALLDLAQSASMKLLQMMHDTRSHLRFWEEKLQAPHGQLRTLVWQTGSVSFARYVYRWSTQLLEVIRTGQTPSSPQPDAVAGIQHRVRALRAIKSGLAVALGEVHLHADTMAGLEMGQGAGEEVSRYTVKMRRALCALGDIHPMSEVDGEDMARGDSTLLMLPGTPLPAHDATNADASPLLTEPPTTTNTTTSSTGGGGPTAPAGDTQHTHQLWQELQHLTLTTHEAESHVRHMLSLYRAPTRKEVTWVYRYARNGAVAAAAMYVAAHSRLNGSPDLERWGQQVVQSVSGFFQEHLVQPMSQIASELQGTFAANDEADTVSLRESRNILGRMLADFDRMHPEVAGEVAKLSNTTAGSMERVLAKFEAEAKSPIRSLVTGDLSNLLMIQMQSMKVQMESALIQMDRILAANEINFAAMAAMPFFATLYGLMTLVRRLSFGGRGAEARREQQRRYLRMLLVEAERALVQCNEEGEAGALEMGLQIFCVNALYVAVREQRPLMSGLEWYNLKTDILELAGPKVAVERKLRILGRMHQSYSIF